jgi:hypothetical protein
MELLLDAFIDLSIHQKKYIILDSNNQILLQQTKDGILTFPSYSSVSIVFKDSIQTNLYTWNDRFICIRLVLPFESYSFPQTMTWMYTEYLHSKTVEEVTPDVNFFICNMYIKENIMKYHGLYAAVV